MNNIIKIICEKPTEDNILFRNNKGEYNWNTPSIAGQQGRDWRQVRDGDVLIDLYSIFSKTIKEPGSSSIGNKEEKQKLTSWVEGIKTKHEGLLHRVVSAIVFFFKDYRVKSTFTRAKEVLEKIDAVQVNKELPIDPSVALQAEPLQLPKVNTVTPKIPALEEPPISALVLYQTYSAKMHVFNSLIQKIALAPNTPNNARKKGLKELQGCLQALDKVTQRLSKFSKRLPEADVMVFFRHHLSIVEAFVQKTDEMSRRPLEFQKIIRFCRQQQARTLLSLQTLVKKLETVSATFKKPEEIHAFSQLLNIHEQIIKAKNVDPANNQFIYFFEELYFKMLELMDKHVIEAVDLINFNAILIHFNAVYDEVSRVREPAKKELLKSIEEQLGFMAKLMIGLIFKNLPIKTLKDHQTLQALMHKQITTTSTFSDKAEIQLPTGSMFTSCELKADKQTDIVINDQSELVLKGFSLSFGVLPGLNINQVRFSFDRYTTHFTISHLEDLKEDNPVSIGVASQFPGFSGILKMSHDANLELFLGEVRSSFKPLTWK